jgi:hypothetical protein
MISRSDPLDVLPGVKTKARMIKGRSHSHDRDSKPVMRPSHQRRELQMQCCWALRHSGGSGSSTVYNHDAIRVGWFEAGGEDEMTRELSSIRLRA